MIEESTALGRLLSQGKKKIGVFVRYDDQKLPAGAYVRGHADLIRHHGAEVVVRVDKSPDIRFGEEWEGFCAIRYDFSPDAGPSLQPPRRRR